MKDDKVYIGHIYEKTSRIISLTNEIEFIEFNDNFLIHDSVIRSLEIIGEAANKLSDDFCEKYPEIPVREMVGLRNILIHAYSDIDLKRVWMIVKNNIPDLHNEVVKILNTE